MPPVRRSLVVVMLLAACELKPPPPKAQPGAPTEAAAPAAKAPTPPPAPTPMPAPTPAPTPTPAPALDDGPDHRPPPPPPVSEACGTLAVHIADVLVQTSEPTQRAFLMQERARLVQQAGASCQRGNWSAEKVKCFAATHTQAELDTCNKMP